MRGRNCTVISFEEFFDKGACQNMHSQYLAFNAKLILPTSHPYCPVIHYFYFINYLFLKQAIHEGLHREHST